MATQRLIFLLVLFIVATGNLLVGTSARGALDVVCKLALDRKFCLNNFGSNRAARTANYQQLAQIAIHRAEVDGAAAKAKAFSLIQSATDPRLKAMLQQCESFYIDALDAIRLAPGDLKKWQYRDLSLHAGTVSDSGAHCEASFKGRFKSPLTAENRDLKLLGNIVGVISNQLSQIN